MNFHDQNNNSVVEREHTWGNYSPLIMQPLAHPLLHPSIPALLWPSIMVIPHDEVLALYWLCKSTLVGSILQLRQRLPGASINAPGSPGANVNAPRLPGASVNAIGSPGATVNAPGTPGAIINVPLSPGAIG